MGQPVGTVGERVSAVGQQVKTVVQQIRIVGQRVSRTAGRSEQWDSRSKQDKTFRIACIESSTAVGPTVPNLELCCGNTSSHAPSPWLWENVVPTRFVVVRVHQSMRTVCHIWTFCLPPTRAPSPISR